MDKVSRMDILVRRKKLEDVIAITDSCYANDSSHVTAYQKGYNAGLKAGFYVCEVKDGSSSFGLKVSGGENVTMLYFVGQIKEIEVRLENLPDDPIKYAMGWNSFVYSIESCGSSIEQIDYARIVVNTPINSLVQEGMHAAATKYLGGEKICLIADQESCVPAVKPTEPSTVSVIVHKTLELFIAVLNHMFKNKQA